MTRIRGALVSALLLAALSTLSGAVPAKALTSRMVVFSGDSITAGVGVGADAIWRDSYPVRAGNLLCGYGCQQYRVVGHGGQCLTASGCAYGPTLLSTFQAEVLNATPVPTSVVVEIGVNDLSHVTDLELQSAYLQLQTWCNAIGVRMFVGTIVPLGADLSWRSVAEPQRERINTWIRSQSWTSGTYLDFDAVLADPTDTLWPAYDSGDHLHPNWMGAVRMADITATLPWN